MIPAVERVAVIDMGSNSWRLVVFGYEPGTPWWSLVDEIREAVRVAAGVGATGALRPERVELALHTAAVFSAFCRATEVDEVEAVATSAIRDASNGDELLADIERTTGLQPRVISGEEEAGPARHRRAGVRPNARRARGADRGACRAAGLEARAGEGDQVRPCRRDPRRRACARHRAPGGRLRRDRGDRGGAARGRLLRPPAR